MPEKNCIDWTMRGAVAGAVLNLIEVEELRELWQMRRSGDEQRRK
jgi:hypothetical protein